MKCRERQPAGQNKSGTENLLALLIKVILPKRLRTANCLRTPGTSLLSNSVSTYLQTSLDERLFAFTVSRPCFIPPLPAPLMVRLICPRRPFLTLPPSYIGKSRRKGRLRGSCAVGRHDGERPACRLRV